MAKASDVVDVEPGNTPAVNLPSTGTGDHDSLVDSALEEGGLDAAFAEIAESDTEPTADDLRRIAGAEAEGMTDEELLAEYEKAKAGDGESAEDVAKAFNVDYLYDAQGNKIADLTKVSVNDLLSGKVQI